jgi:hypothetical protein
MYLSYSDEVNETNNNRNHKCLVGHKLSGFSDVTLWTPMPAELSDICEDELLLFFAIKWLESKKCDEHKTS